MFFPLWCLAISAMPQCKGLFKLIFFKDWPSIVNHSLTVLLIIVRFCTWVALTINQQKGRKKLHCVITTNYWFIFPKVLSTWVKAENLWKQAEISRCRKDTDYFPHYIVIIMVYLPQSTFTPFRYYQNISAYFGMPSPLSSHHTFLLRIVKGS